MKHLITTLATVLVCTPLAAQELDVEQAVPKTTKDLVADPPFPQPQPNEHHKVLAREAGTWDAEIKMYLQGPQGPATEYKGQEQVEMVSGGLFSRSTFTSTFGDRKFEGHGLFGWDPHQEKYTGVWVDNFNAAPQTMTGTYDAEAKALTLVGNVQDDSGNEFQQKQVSTFVDETTRTFENYLIVDQGGQQVEIKLLEIVSKKRE